MKEKTKENEIIDEIIKKVRTKSELITLLDNIANKKIKDETLNKTYFEIEKKLLSIPQVKIEIAFEPREEFINNLVNWFENNLKGKFIIDIIVNHKIVGGAIIEYNGLFRDFSLLKGINNLTQSGKI